MATDSTRTSRAVGLLKVLCWASWLCSVLGCAYRPARYADALAVTYVDDDRPIAVPKVRQVIDELYEADVYVRRELVKGLEPRRVQPAQDVNSYDEVPRSSWFSPPRSVHLPLSGYRRAGPPQPPLSWLPNAIAKSGSPGARVAEDARGVRYEMLADPKKQQGLVSAAVAVSSRIVYALGYRTAESYIYTDAKGLRFAARRWPVGIDLGPTPINARRGDDPNDRVEHRERRTLRVLRLVGAWLGLRRLEPRMLRDAYVGDPAKGHVQHFLLGFEGSLGVRSLADAVAWLNDDDRQQRNFFLRMFSMGLSPKPFAEKPNPPFPSVGLLPPNVLVNAHGFSPPFEPSDRLLPSDAYWLAKRVAVVSEKTLAAAVMAARLPAHAQTWLYQTLLLRRAQVVTYGYGAVAPLEAEGFQGRVLVLFDLALTSRVFSAADTSYRVSILDQDGKTVLRVPEQRAAGPLQVPLAANPNYQVIQVEVLRKGRPTPEPYQAHVIDAASDLPRLVGVKH